MKILLPPLLEEIRNLYAQAKNLFVIVSPWIKDEILEYVLNQNPKEGIRHRVLLRGDLRDFLSGSSDLKSLKRLLALGSEVRLLRNLHAKIYLADQSQAIVASANLTPSGLEENLELGVLLDEPDQITGLMGVVEDWFGQGRVVDADWLAEMQALLKLHKPEGTALREVDRWLRQSGDHLKGNRISLLKAPGKQRRKKSTNSPQSNSGYRWD